MNYTFRMHDPRVGRFFARDPLEQEYPYLSPYHFSHNSPIYTKEIEGLEGVGSTYGAEYAHGYTIKDPKKRKEYFENIENMHKYSAAGTITGVGIWAGGSYLYCLGLRGTITLIANETKDEVLSIVTNGASDILDLSKTGYNLLKAGWKKLLHKTNNTVDNGAGNILKSLDDAKDLTERRNRIAKFDDPDHGSDMRDEEVDGLAIFEKSLGKGKLSESKISGTDAMLGNKTISHFGTGPVGKKSYNDKQFNTWIEVTFKKHMGDKQDYYVIDLKNFTKEQREKVIAKVQEMGDQVAKKTHVIK